MEINSNFLDALGFTLVDSLWQGLVIMAVAFLGLAILRKAPARWKHNFLLVCILALPIAGTYSFRLYQGFNIVSIENNVSTPEMIPSTSVLMNAEESSSTSQLQMEAFWLVDKAHWIGLLWIIGLLLVSLRGVGGILYLNRLKTNATEVQQPEIVRLLKVLRDDFGLRTTVLIKESSKIMSPLVSGYFKPVILFPLGLIQGLSTEEVEVILLHELAHLKRNDFLINIVITGLRAVYFYHPAYWWLQSQLDNEREYATDEMVMSKQSNGLLLVKALAKTQEYKMTTTSLGFAGNSKNQLLKRVNRIMKKQQNPNWLSGVFTMLILSTAFILMSQSQQQKIEIEDFSREAEAIDTTKGISRFTIYPDTPEAKKDSLMATLGPKTRVSIDIDGPVSYYNGGGPMRPDTTSLALAIQEIIQVPSPIMVESSGKGEIITIKRNGKLLEGSDFETYQKAYEQLNNYATKKIKSNVGNFRKLAQLSGIALHDDSTNFSKLAQYTRVDLSNDSISAAALTKLLLSYELLSMQEQVRLNGAQQRIEALKKEEALADELVRRLTEKPSTEKAIELSKYMSEFVKLERYMAAINQERSVIEKQNVEFLKELDLYKLKMLQGKEITEYERRLKELIEKKEIKSKSGKALEIELQLREMALKMKELRYNLEKEQQMVFKEKAERIIREREEATTTQTYDFTDSAQAQEEAKEVLRVQNEKNKRPLIRLNGKFKPKMELTREDISKMDIVSIAIYKGEKALGKFPKKKVKGFDSVIDIKTK